MSSDNDSEALPPTNLLEESMLVTCLNSEEHFERWFAMQTLLHQPVHLWPTALQLPSSNSWESEPGGELDYWSQLQAPRLLANQLQDEQSAKHRCMAALLLSQWTAYFARQVRSLSMQDTALAFGQRQPVFPWDAGRLISLAYGFAFQRIFPLFLHHFPVNSLQDGGSLYFDQHPTNDNKELGTPATADPEVLYRVYLLRAIGIFLDWNQDLAFADYMDAVYFTLLDSRVRWVYQLQVFYALTNHLELTPRNRYRLGLFFERIEMLSTKDEAHRTRPPALQRQIAEFWSTWAPIRNPHAISAEEAGMALGSAESLLTYSSQGSLQELAAEAPTTPEALVQVLRDKLQVGSIQVSAESLATNSGLGKKLTRIPIPKTIQDPVTPADAITLASSVPDGISKEDVTFNLAGNQLTFDRLPYTREIFLQNKSINVAVPFRIQMSPHYCFRVQPSFGLLGRGETLSLMVTFDPSGCDFRTKAKMEGYMRLRLADGTSIERIALTAFITPVLTVNVNEIDFGYNLIDKPKVAAFYVQNVSPIEVPVNITPLASPSSDLYEIDNSQFFLQPGERNVVKVTFTATTEGNWTDSILVSSIGHDKRTVSMCAHAGPVLLCDTEKLDFGRMQMDMDVKKPTSVLRKFTVQNVTDRPLPIVVQPSSDELMVDEKDVLELVLLPKQRLVLPVRFTPKTPGDFAGSVSIICANMPTLPIHVQAAVAMLSIGVHHELIAPLTLVGAESTMLLPIGWLGSPSVVTHQDGTVHASIEFDKSPFQVVFPKDAKGAPAVADKSGNWAFEIRENLAMVRIAFAPKLFGCFRVKAKITVGKMVARVYFSGASFVPMDMEPEKLDKIRKFLRDPSLVPPVPFPTPKPGTAAKDLLFPFTVKIKAGELNAVGGEMDTILEPPSAKGQRYITTSPRNEPRIASFVIQNSKSAAQKYRLFLHGPVESSVELEGMLPAYGELEVCLRLDDRMLRPDHQTDLGMVWYQAGVSVMGSNFTTQFVPFGGILSEAMTVAFNCYPSTPVPFFKTPLPFFCIPATAGLGKKNVRKVTILNRSGMELPWNVKILTFSSPNFLETVEPQTPIQLPKVGGEDGGIMKPLPSNGLLKPFSSTEVAIECVTSASGEYVGKLWIEYTDPSAKGDPDLDGVKRLSEPIILTFACGAPEFQLAESEFEIGDRDVNNLAVVPFTVKNNSLLPARHTSLLYRNPLKMPSPFFVASPRSAEELMFALQSELWKTAFTLDIANELFQKSVPVLGSIGRASLRSNLLSVDLPRKASASVKLVEPYNFGIIPRLSFKCQTFTLTNDGNLNLTITGVMSLDPYLVCKLPPARMGEDADRAVTADESLAPHSLFDGSLVEIDWDELQENVNTTNQDGFVLTGKAEPASLRQLTSVEKFLPITLRPGHSVEFLLFYGGFEGMRSGQLEVLTERFGGLVDTFVVPFRGTSKPFIQILESTLDFGVCAVLGNAQAEIKFANVGTNPFSWTLDPVTTRIVMHHESSKQVDISRYSTEDITKMISVFPTQGSLEPSCSQTLSVRFRPAIPSYEIIQNFMLNLGILGSYPLLIRGIGAGTLLKSTMSSMDFGTLRVGLERKQFLPLMNKGALRLQYYVECKDSQLIISPEQGVIDGFGHSVLSVRYVAGRPGKTDTVIRIVPVSTETYALEPITVKVTGLACYPEVFVETSKVDFGVALFKCPNVQTITVENRGAVDAELRFQSFHPCISVEEKNIVLLPKSKTDIRVIYLPVTVEKLVSKGIFRSTDPRGQMSTVLFSGTVGVPKLLFDPPDFITDLDFGVCKVKTVETKTMVMKNEGNIDLNFMFIIQREPSVPRDMFTITPSSGSLKIGDSVTITVQYNPREMVESKVRVTLDYRFASMKGQIRGTGGVYILSVDLPTPLVDFGACRMMRPSNKEVVIFNHGNYGANYRLRPEPADQDWSRYDGVSADDPSSDLWKEELQRLGVEITNPDGFCQPFNRTIISIVYKPETVTAFSRKFRLYYGDTQCDDFEVRGAGATAKLELLDGDQPFEIIPGTNLAHKDMGTHSVSTEHAVTFKLRNSGYFGVNFLVQPFGMDEFEVSPRRGFVEPGKMVPLNLFFRPMAEDHYQVLMKVLREQGPIAVQLTGIGGIGRLMIQYADEKDLQAKCLDFGLVPNTVAPEKRFFLYNDGLVEISFQISVDVFQFSISRVGEPFSARSTPDTTAIRPGTGARNMSSQWFREMTMVLGPKQGIELSVRFDAKQADTNLPLAGTISFVSPVRTTKLPVRGRSGTFGLSHRGETMFGDIATNFQYSRKVTIVNTGSIPASLNFSWALGGSVSGEGQGTAYVKLSESNGSNDPRSRWARQQYNADRNLPLEAPMTAKDYWNMLREVVHIPTDTRKQRVVTATLRMKMRSREESRARIRSATMSAKRRQNIGTPGSVTTAEGVENGSQANLESVASAQATQMIKRKQSFFHVVSTTVVSSQSSTTFSPYLRVEPSMLYLQPYSSVEVRVEMALASEETFLATLLCNPNVIGAQPYEIAVSATPKSVNIVLDDTSTLNFGKQPIGETETLWRRFKNVGKKEVQWTINHRNSSLQVNPRKGTLAAGQEVRVLFVFSPTDESTQTSPVYFEVDCSTPVRLPFYGGGGFAKISLAKYKRFDFGFCMIGKNTESGLPITNEGNATLHLTTFELTENEVYRKGGSWPQKKISLAPGETFMLQIVFCPMVENPAPGSLVVGTNGQKWEIELVGSGREAVLIVSRISLEFMECIVGNRYEQKLGLKNVGDVNYPVEFRTDPPMEEFTFDPPSVLLKPFSEGHVSVIYSPQQEVQGGLDLVVSSPYSVYYIPMTIHAGTVDIEFVPRLLDFGMFEKSTKPTMTVTIRNKGTIKTNFMVRTHVKPALFTVGNFRGILRPDTSADVTVCYSRAEVHQIQDKLTVKTDMTDKLFTMPIRGQAEEAFIKLEEFSLVNLGVSPAMETISKSFTITNYGRYPLQLDAQATYPIKIYPTSATVDGESSVEMHVSWYPSGGYELRSVIKLLTSIGTFDVMVRGKALLPELVLRQNIIDFGVCALGLTYDAHFTIANKGKVPLYWNLPSPKDGFAFPKEKGELRPGGSEDILVQFTPSELGRKANTFLLECRGLSFKELHVSGVGGTVGLKMTPDRIDFGTCPCFHQVSQKVTLFNTGSVKLRFHFVAEGLQQVNGLRILLPHALDVQPRESKSVVVGVIASTEGKFSTSVKVMAREKEFLIPLEGTGIKIRLSGRMSRLLQHEMLHALKPVEALTGGPAMVDSMDAILYRQRISLDSEMQVLQTLRTLSNLPVAEPLTAAATAWKQATKPGTRKERHVRLLQFLRNRLKDGKGLTGEDFQEVEREFLAWKRDISLDVQVPTEDAVAKAVMDYPYIKIEEMDLTPILKPIELAHVELDLYPILARPPPFELLSQTTGSSQDSVQVQQTPNPLSDKKYKRPYMLDPMLPRKARNAGTMDILRGPHITIRVPKRVVRNDPDHQEIHCSSIAMVDPNGQEDAAGTGRSYLSHLHYHYPLKILVPRVLGVSGNRLHRAAAMYLISYGGGMVDGDQTEIRIQLEAHARLLLLTQASTKIFKKRTPQCTDIAESTTPRANPAGSCAACQQTYQQRVSRSGAQQSMKAHISDGALLCVLPEPAVAFRDASYEQRQTFTVNMHDGPAFAESGSVLVLDWFTSGRKSCGESWQFQRLLSENQVFLQSSREDLTLLLRDALLLDRHEAQQRMQGSPFAYHRLPYHVYATVVLIGPKVQAMACRLLALAQSDRFRQRSSAAATTTASSTDPNIPPTFLWSASSCDTRLFRCDSGTAPCWNCQRTRSQPTECSMGAVLKLAGTSVEEVRTFLHETVLLEVADLVGDNLFQRTL